MKRLMVACAAVAACLMAIAADKTVSDPIPLASGEVKVIDVPSGETHTYSGVISGDGSVQKTGLGTLVLSGANTYSGGFDLVAGKVQVKSATAFGAGTGTVKVSGSTGNTGANSPQIFFMVAGAMIANGFLLDGSDALAHDDYPVFMFDANTSLDGDITCDAAAGVTTLRIGSSTSLSTTERNSLVVHFYGSLARSDGGALQVRYRVYGNAHIHKAVAFSSLYVGVAYSGEGSLHLYDSENTFTEWISLRRANLVCEAANVLGGAYLTWNNEATGKLDLNGFGQTIKFIDDEKQTGQPDTFRPITSAKPATLTISGVNKSMRGSCSRISGPISLVLDCDKDKMQNFCVRQHTMSGSIWVKSGILGSSSGATFSNVQALRIDADGQVLVRDSGALVYSGVTNLTVEGVFDSTASKSTNIFQATLKSLVIGSDATFNLYSGSVVQAEYLKVGEQEYARGTFTHADFPQIGEGTTINVYGPVGPVPEVSWTGAGADDSMATPGNWSSSDFDLDDAKMTAVFATGGTQAQVDRDVYLAGVVFDAPEGQDGFTLADAGGAVSLDSNGILVRGAADDGARTYTFGPAVDVVFDQVWNVPSNQTVRFESGFSVPADKTLALMGEGTYAWNGTNTLSSGMVVSGGVLRVSGMIASPDHVWEGAAAAGDGKGIELFQSTAQTEAGTSDRSSVLLLDNAVIEKPVVAHNWIGTTVIGAAAGTTNELAGYVCRSRYSLMGLDDGWGGFYVPEGAEIILSGGYGDSYAATRLEGGGTLRIRNRPITVRNSLAFNPERGKVIFEVANNDFTYFILGNGNGNSANTAAEFLVSDALVNGTFACGVWYNGGCIPATNPRCDVEFHSTTQSVDRLAAFPKATLHGDYPSMLRICGNQNAGGNYLKTGYEYVSAKIEGGLGLEMAGTGTLTLKDQAFASCGDLKVSSGAMEFASNASWLNGTNVTVCGTGTLRLNASKTLGRKSVVRVDGSGVISIANGCTQRIRTLFVGETEIAPGTYTKANAPEVLKPHLADTTGVLAVTGDGIVLIVR